MISACVSILLAVLTESALRLHCPSIELFAFTFRSSLSLTAGVLKFLLLHYKLALDLLEWVQFCCFVVIEQPGVHCSEAAAPFAAVCCFSFMYPAGSGDGTSEMFDETPAVPLVTVAKRYRKQTSQTGSDDFVCIAEQSGLAEVQASPELGPAVASSDEPSDLVLGPLLPPPSFTAAQSGSQVVATPAPACSPLQILDGDGDLTLETGDAHIQVSPTKPGSTSSQDFLSATEPFSVILDDEPPLQLHALQHSAATPMDAAFGTSGVRTGRTALQDTLVQTVSSMPCKRTAWDLGRSSFRAVSKARHGMLSSCTLPTKPVD